MNKSCLHCHQKLGFLQAVRGELFCSSEHRELYFQAEAALAFERVTSFDKPATPAPIAVETPKPQPVLEAQPAPVVAAVPVSVPEVTVPEPTVPVVTKEVRPMLVAAAEPAPIPEAKLDVPPMPVVAPEPVPVPKAKVDVPPVPVGVPEPVKIPEVVPEPVRLAEAKVDVPPPPVVVPEPVKIPEVAPEPVRVAEAKVDVPPIPEILPEPVRVAQAEPEAKPEVKEEVPVIPVVASHPPSAPRVKEAEPVLAAPETVKAMKATPGPAKRNWVAPAVAACLAIVVLGAIFFGPSKKSQPSLLPATTAPLAAAEPPTNTVHADSTLVPAPVAATPAPPPPAPQAEPAPAKPAAPAPAPAPVKPAPAPVVIASASGVRHAASITVKEASWVAVCSDGTEVLSAMMSPGDERKIDFTGRAIVRTGNAGGISIAMDGKSIGSVGPPGGLRVVELNPQTNPHGFHLLALKPGDNGACVSN